MKNASVGPSIGSFAAPVFASFRRCVVWAGLLGSGVTSPIELWWGIQPISAGLFGVPVGFAVIILVSLVTPAPSKKIQELVEHVRYPHLRGDISTQAN